MGITKMTARGRRASYRIALERSKQRKIPLPEINAAAAVLVFEIMLIAHDRIPPWAMFLLAYTVATALFPVLFAVQALGRLRRLLWTELPA
jgi:hypothetical protein